jgi:preprotein translocase subunit SecE
LAEAVQIYRERSEAMAKTSPGEFLRQVRSEASKIHWPTRQETVVTAIFVGIMMLLLALFFLGIDTVFGSAVRWLLSLV